MLYQSDINTAITNCDTYIKEITTNLVNSLSYGTKRQLQLKRNLNVLKGCKRILNNYTPYDFEPNTLNKIICSKSELVTVNSIQYYTDIISGYYDNSVGRNDVGNAPSHNKYTFTINEISNIKIFLDTTEQVDAYVHLLNSGNTEIANNDDGGGNRDSYLTYDNLPAGTYTIVANTYSAGSYGNYTLKFYCSNPTTGDLNFTNYQRAYNLGLQLPNSIIHGDTVYAYFDTVYTVNIENGSTSLNILSSKDSILNSYNSLTQVQLQNIIDTIEEYKDKEYNSTVSVTTPTNNVYKGNHPEVQCESGGSGGDHEQNSDTKLANGTSDEVTAAEIRTHLDNSDIHLTTSQITALISTVLSSQNDATFNGPNQVKVADENGNIKIITIGEDEILSVNNGIIKSLKINRIIGGGASTTF